MNRKPTVMIVDDDPAVRNGVGALLASCDFDVVAAVEDGLQACHKIDLVHPDIVVLDAAMPVMRGPEAARRIRSMSPETRIIAFSATVIGPVMWADASVSKDRMSELPGVVEWLAPRHDS